MTACDFCSSQRRQIGLRPLRKRRSVVGRALIVVLVILGLLVAGSAWINETRKRRQESVDKFEKLEKDVTGELRRKFEEKGEVSIADQNRAVAKFRNGLDESAKVGGEEGKAMKAMSDFIAERHVASAPYFQFVKRMAAEEPFNLVRVKSKSDLALRRELGAELQKKSREFGAHSEGSVEHLKSVLGSAGLNPAMAKGVLDGYNETYGKSIRLQRRVRAADEVIAEGLLEMCDLLEVDWGKWKVEKDTPIFDSNATADKYNAIIARVNKAAAEQADAQREAMKADR